MYCDRKLLPEFIIFCELEALPFCKIGLREFSCKMHKLLEENTCLKAPANDISGAAHTSLRLILDALHVRSTVGWVVFL